MDLERVLYKKMTKDELIDKLIAYKNIECHDRAIAHEFLCMQKEDNKNTDKVAAISCLSFVYIFIFTSTLNYS